MGEMGNHPCSGRQRTVKTPAKTQSTQQSQENTKPSGSNPASGPRAWAVSSQQTNVGECAGRQERPQPSRPSTANSGAGETKSNYDVVTGTSVVDRHTTVDSHRVTMGSRNEECVMPGASTEDSQGHLAPTGGRSSGDAQINDVLRRLHAAEAKCRELETQNQVLQQSLANAEQSPGSSTATRRHDETRGEHLERAHSRLSHESSSETVEAQNKIISSLQTQLQTAADELKSLREQFNRRLKKQRCASAELRTEAGITIMHLREEKVELCAENEQLKSDLQVLRMQKPSSPPNARADHNDEDSGGGDGYALLIAELSGQVEHLSSELKKAKRKIKSLQRPAKPTASAPSLAADWDDDVNG